MSAKEKQQKKNSGGKKKRKNISPLCSDSTQDNNNTHRTVYTTSDATVCTQQSDQKTVSNQNSNQNKRFHPSSPEYFVFESPGMNFTQQQYPGQIAQSPHNQYTPQYMTLTPNPSNPTVPPTWAVTMIDDIKNIKDKVAKIEHVEKTVDSINLKLTLLETKVDGIDKRVVEVEQNCVFISGKFDDQSGELKNAKDKIRDLQSSCDSLKRSMTSLQDSCDRMDDRVADGEYRSMRDNLIFYGIPEMQANRTGAGANVDENCGDLVKRLISEHLKINADGMLFDRAHRLGAPNRGNRPRPIVVKFHYYQERERVRTAAGAVRDELKRADRGVGVQLPKEWREARKSLHGVFQEQKKRGNRVKFVGSKLFVNGEQYKQPANRA